MRAFYFAACFVTPWPEGFLDISTVYTELKEILTGENHVHMQAACSASTRCRLRRLTLLHDG